MHDPLTPIERRVYHYLIDYLASHTYQPSVREIGRRFRIRSTKSVAEVIESLAEKGFVERPDGRSRGVKLIGHSSIGRTQPVPVYAQVNPTEPHFTSDHRSRFVAMDRAFLPSDEVFFLRVPDESMQARGIWAGDLILLDPSARSRDGDIVAARVGGAVFVRLIEHRGANVSLSAPGEGNLTDGVVPDVTLGPRDDFAILGVVVGLLRGVLQDQADDDDEGAASEDHPS
ncbi:MAG: transcriptional repressor LexA [Gemmatimonadaceae bacterium]